MCVCHEISQAIISIEASIGLSSIYFFCRFYLYSTFHNTHCFKAGLQKIIKLMFIISSSCIYRLKPDDNIACIRKCYKPSIINIMRVCILVDIYVQTVDNTLLTVSNSASSSH